MRFGWKYAAWTPMMCEIQYPTPTDVPAVKLLAEQVSALPQATSEKLDEFTKPAPANAKSPDGAGASVTPSLSEAPGRPSHDSGAGPWRTWTIGSGFCTSMTNVVTRRTMKKPDTSRRSQAPVG